MLKNHTVRGLGWSLNFFYIELNRSIVYEIDQVRSCLYCVKRAKCIICKEENERLWLWGISCSLVLSPVFP